ncbi:reverse transcriptase-like protein [Haloarcula onubensis]|uniref:Reverse transcriptase-like protein n=1 Tax=Haloarcula onubensis TaxID=2950539 RepID=A0ABU2FJS0_9EURY|nr:reverse transcriptase-like protein [Halomicroarcula sp. S3CR25-11]MDS0280988.1 reverse transcriptase-like protein [Halomicroarcula sp. S3CR25-11]
MAGPHGDESDARRSHTAFAPSLLLYFDASVLYGPDNATPTSAAVGFLVESGATTHVERSMAVDAFVSSAHLEYRALLEAVRAVAATDERVASLHVHGDADAVIRAVDPDHPATPGDRLCRRRVRAIRDAVDGIPVVTYRVVDRRENERAHGLARAGHR